MKILYIPAYFAPEQFSSLYLGNDRCDALVKENLTTIVYTPMPTRSVTAEVRKEYMRNRRTEVLHDGKLIVKRFSLFGEGKNPLIRAIRYTLQCAKQFLWGAFSKEAKSGDVIFVDSTPPIQGAMAAMVKKFNKKPMVYNLQDIFPDSLVGTGLTKKGSLLWKIGRVIEDFTYRNADKIVVISEDFKRNIMAKGVPEEKIEIIYNWVDEQAVVDVPREKNVLFDRYGLDRKKFYVTYCGNIGLTQNMDMLLSVAKDLEREPNIQFVLIGEGAYKKRVEEIIAEKILANVRLLPFQPYEEISHVFSLGDVGLVISKPGVGENSVPSKTWSILSASRPVVANFDENELKTILTDNQCGIFTKAGDKEAFTQAILTLYEDKERSAQLGRNGREFIMKNLTKAVGTGKFVEVIKSFA